MPTPLVRMIRARVLVLLALTPACYHATVETGAAPSDQVVERCCQAAYLGGLVPPKPVQSAAACPEGVARVETSRSFSNLVFTVLTAGLYSPVSMRITCASAVAAAPPVAAGPLLPAPDYAPPWFVLPSTPPGDSQALGGPTANAVVGGAAQ